MKKILKSEHNQEVVTVFAGGILLAPSIYSVVEKHSFFNNPSHLEIQLQAMGLGFLMIVVALILRGLIVGLFKGEKDDST